MDTPLPRTAQDTHDTAVTLDAALAAWAVHDRRLDGRVFLGVTSTGIYCRPVCRARLPRREHCRVFPGAAQAEAAGFRPCLRCRPELAPGLSRSDSSDVLADQAARLLTAAAHGDALRAAPAHEARAGDAEAAGSERRAVAAVAARLGITDRHLRRIFVERHGVAPRDFVTTARLLLAKRLLTDTDLPVTEVAVACGFGSLRRFHAAFAQRYRLNPTGLRGRRAALPHGDVEAVQAHTFTLAWRPPYAATAMQAFLQARLVDGIEASDGTGGFVRTLAVPHEGRVIAGWIRVRWQPDAVALDVGPALMPAVGEVLARTRHALDLDADPQAIAQRLNDLPCRAPEGLRIAAGFDGFEAAVRVILGQQVSVRAACTLAGRLVARLATPVSTPWAGLTHAFPTARAVAEAAPETIGTLGIVRQRVRALQGLARAVASGAIALDRSAPIESTRRALLAIDGVGPWTAELILMRSLGWPDAWPAGDIGLRRAMAPATDAEAGDHAKRWSPYRAYATMALWHADAEPRLEQAPEAEPEGRPR